MERLPDEIEQTPGGKEFARKTEQKFHDKIQGKQSKEDLKIQRKQQKEYSDERKVVFQHQVFSNKSATLIPLGIKGTNK